MSTFESLIRSDEEANAAELVATTEEAVATIKKRSVRGAVSYTLRNLLIMGIGLAANGALTVYLSPAEYGVYYLVLSLTGLFTFLSDVGLAASLIQRKTEPSLTDLRTTFTVQQGLALGIALLMTALTPLWQRLFHLNGTELQLVYALAFSFPLASLKTIPSILLERKLRFDLLALPALAENLVFSLIAVFLAWRGAGVMSYTLAIWARGFVGVVCMYAIQRWPLGVAFSRESLRHLLHLGVKFQINDLLARLKDDLYLVVLGTWLGRQDFGYVSWAKNWTKYPYTMGVANIMAVTFPTFSRLQHDTNLLKRAIEKSLFFVTLGIFPVLTGAAVFLTPLTLVWPKYHKWEPAVLSFALFSLNILISAISSPLTNALNAIGQINKTLKLMVLWLVLTWTLTPIAVWKLGFEGVALTSALVALTSFLTVRMVRQVVPIAVWPAVRWQTLALIPLLAVGIVGKDMWSQSYFWLAVGILAGGAAYTLSFLALGWHDLRRELRSLGAQI